MSWKSFVTAGLLCVLASPAFAAPTISMTHNGANANNYLDANGNFVWQVQLSQSNPVVDIDNPNVVDGDEGSPLAAELGFTTRNGGATGTTAASDIATITVNSSAGNFDDPNPGNVIFGWEDLTALGGTGTCDSAAPGNCPVGLLWSDLGDTAANGLAPNNQAFSAFGSGDYGSSTAPKNYLQIVAAGPNTGTTADANGNLKYTVSVSGAYATGTGGPGTTDTGRIAELNDAYDGDGTPPISLNHDGYNNVFTRTVIPGDADLSGDVDGGDLNILLTNFFGAATGQKWFTANFDNHLNGDVDGNDLNILLTNFFKAPVIVGPSGGPGPGGVPEPATMALVALAGLGLIGLRRRG